MNICTSAKHTHPFSFFSRFVCSGILIVGISACGGGGGSSPITTPEPPTAALMTPGAYIGTLIGKSDNLPKEWVSILLPTEPASGGLTKFYALHYDDTNPDIYSGSGQIVGNSSIPLAQITYYPHLATSVRTGSGSLSTNRSGEIRASLNFPATNSANAFAISNLDHRFPSDYIYNTPARLDAVQGNWQGNLSYGSGSNGAFTISISATGAFNSYMSFLGDCQFSLGELTPSFDGANLYKFSVSIPNATLCTKSNLGGNVFNGAAFITTSHVAGKTQRLYVVGVTSDGRGISFKADR